MVWLGRRFLSLENIIFSSRYDVPMFEMPRKWLQKMSGLFAVMKARCMGGEWKCEWGCTLRQPRCPEMFGQSWERVSGLGLMSWNRLGNIEEGTGYRESSLVLGIEDQNRRGTGRGLGSC